MPTLFEDRVPAKHALPPDIAMHLPANDNGMAWKDKVDAERPVEAGNVLDLQRWHLARRAYAFTWKAPRNDNQAWPLLAQLRRDGNEVLVPVAERYRRTFDRAAMNGLQGVDVEGNVFNVVQQPAVKSDPDMRTKGPMKLAHTAGQAHGGRKVIPINEDKRKNDDKPNPTRPGTARSYSKRTDEIAVSVIDAKRDLHRLRAALGPLVEAFEEAVLDGDTLTEIGQRRDAGQSSPGAGKLVVMMGLQAVQAEFRKMDRERRAAA